MANLVILGKNGDGTGHLPLQEKPSHLQFLFSQGSEARVSTERSFADAAILLRVSGHWVVLPHPGADPLEVNGVPVVSLKVLDHGDTLQVNGLRLRLAELRGEILTADSQLVQQKKACQVCKASFQPAEQVLVCPICSLAHHDGCLRYNRKCAGRPFCGYVLPKDEWETQEAGR